MISHYKDKTVSRPSFLYNGNPILLRRHLYIHDEVIKWKHFPRYLPFVRGIHRSSVNSPHKDQWRGALIFPLICAWIPGWVNNREAGDLRRHRAHYDVIVMLKRGTESTRCWFSSEILWHIYRVLRLIIQPSERISILLAATLHIRVTARSNVASRVLISCSVISYSSQVKFPV